MTPVELRRALSYASTFSDSDSRPRLAVRETGPEPRPPRLLDRVREALRARHYRRRTEDSYVAWIRRYILFHSKRYPSELGAPEITRFLTSLAVEGRVAASTQNQALSALLFLYREVLAVDLPWLDGLVRAKRPGHVPVVLARDEVRALLQRLDGVPRLMAYLLYGAGLRVLECCQLRVQDVDFAANQIVVRSGTGSKDRVTMLPAVARAALASHLHVVQAQHDQLVELLPKRIKLLKEAIHAGVSARPTGSPSSQFRPPSQFRPRRGRSPARAAEGRPGPSTKWPVPCPHCHARAARGGGSRRSRPRPSRGGRRRSR